MKRKLQKALAMLLVLCFAISLAPMALADSTETSGTCGENLTWSLDTDTGVLTISGAGEMYNYYSTDDKAPWRSQETSITSAIIGDGITSIGNYAFYSCTKLVDITIPDSVTSIGSYAFYGCSSMIEISVAEGNTAYCSADGVLFNKNMTKLISYPAAKTDSSYTIPDSVTSIGNGAFYDCRSLTSVTIPDSVTSIGNSAFYECSNLASVTIPDGVTSIRSNTFSYCSSLASITIPDSVNSIGEEAFYWCRSLASVAIPDGVTIIGNSAFSGCSNLASVTIPDGVTYIGSSAFSYCSSLTSVTIPNGVTSIEDKTFYNCSSLTGITIPDSITSVGSYVFYGCSSLASITIPDSVTGIGDYIFYGCSSLASITLPSGITYIGLEAFYYCTRLVDITIPDSVTYIGWRAFYGCYGLKSITIPDGVTEIESGAFCLCGTLSSVTIPESVTTIGYRAFYGCDISDVYYSGSEARLRAITSQYDGNGALLSATIHYTNTDTSGSSDDDDDGGDTTSTPTLFTESVTIGIGETNVLAASWSMIFEEDSEELTVSISSGDSSVIEITSDTEISYTHTAGTYEWKVCLIYVNALSVGTADIILTTSDGYTTSVTIEVCENEGFEFYTATSTSYLGIGSTIGMYVGYRLADGTLDTSTTEFISVVTDSSIAEVTPVEWCDGYGMLYSITAKSVGTTYLTVTHPITGDSSTIPLVVLEDEVVYKFDEVPTAIYEEGKVTNFYNYSGMVVDEFEYTAHKDSGGNIDYYIVTMDVYNKLNLYGAVTAYDSGGNPTGFCIIDKKESNNTSLVSSLSELYYSVGDLFYLISNEKYYSGESICKKTEVEINVPVGGYLEISNSTESAIATLANSLSILIEGAKFVADFAEDLGNIDTSDVYEIITETLSEEFLDKQILETVKKTAKEELNHANWNYDNFQDCLQAFMDRLTDSGINIAEALANKLSLKTGLSIAESTINKILPTGVIINFLWTLNDGANVAMHCILFNQSEGYPDGIYLYAPTSDDGTISSNGVIVTDSTPNVTIHAYLVVDPYEFEVTNETITENTYELYSITMYNDGEVTQPGSTVSVKIPITKTFDSIDNSTLKVYRVNDDGTITDMNATVVDGYLVFETDHFSYYVVVGNGADNDSELITEATVSISTSVSSKQITVTFSADGNGSDITGYTIVLKNGDTEVETQTATEAGSITFTGLTNGTTYTVEVTAVNGVGSTTETTTATPKSSGGGGGGSSSTSTTTTTTTTTTTASTTDTTDTTDAAADDAPAFTDVESDSYYAEAVAWAVEQGITTGTSDTTFSPEAACTRAQAVTFLWRAAGSPEVSGENPFADMSEDDYYYTAVLWALQNGITTGTSDDAFSPDATCTRAEIVTFLYRASGETAEAAETFTDVTADAWYAEAVAWAAAEGITTGTSETTFTPDASCTRGQIVTFLYRNMA